MSYLNRISASKEERSAAANKRVAKEAEQQLSVDIMTTERRISETEGYIEEAKGQVPFNAGNIIKLQRQLAAYNEDLASLKELKETEFSAE